MDVAKEHGTINMVAAKNNIEKYRHAAPRIFQAWSGISGA